MKYTFLLLFHIVFSASTFVRGQENNTNTTLLNPNTTSSIVKPTPSQSPSINLNETDEESFLGMFLTPPWGEPSFGQYYFNSIQYESGFPYFLDICRYGWSWTPSYLRKSAPFCYDVHPRPSWAQRKEYDYTAINSYEVTTMCDALGGTVYNDKLCIEDPAKPFTVVGPVCWNETFYNTKTLKTCQAVGGHFIGGEYDAIFNATSYNEYLLSEDGSFEFVLDSYRSDAAWCAVPGKHTLVGPTCFGQECCVGQQVDGN